jgi:predicted transcriptional regulator
MRFSVLRLFLFLTFIFSTSSFAAPNVGDVLPTVVFSGEKGGLVTGATWSTDTIKGKVWAMFYVDPDKKDINGELEDKIKEQKFPVEKFGSIAVINMAATWLPNGIIASSLKSKQEKFPLTVYVKDLDKVLVKEWKLADDTYDVMIFDAEGKLRFYKSGALVAGDIDSFIGKVKELIGTP